MARRRKSGPLHAISGYPKGNTITDYHGKVIGRIVRKSCKRVPYGARGSWISGERCSYVVEAGGRRYAGRGRGEGIHVNLRQMRGRTGLGRSR